MNRIFAGKRIVIGVTGSIAAFKVAGWVSELAKAEALVSVVMTDAACRFVAPLTFAALSGNPVHTAMFEKSGTGEGQVNHTADPMSHISLGRDTDIILIAPATANTIARLANGMADDLLSTTVLASRAPILICPAMNVRMFEHPAVQKNIEKLRSLGYRVIDPACGMMACKEEGQGRLAEWEVVREAVARSLSQQDLAGVPVLVTAGPTREPLDPARFLSNRSSGKMGYVLASAAARRGATVTLVSGPTNLPSPPGVSRINVQTAQEMYETVTNHFKDCRVVIKAAAVADYRPASRAEHKVKKEAIDSSLEMERNPDILKSLGQMKTRNQILVGFAAESRRLVEEGQRKLESKNLDFIAVNDISGSNSGFEVDSNQVLLLSKEGQEQLPLTSKFHTANLILDRVARKLAQL